MKDFISSGMFIYILIWYIFLKQIRHFFSKINFKRLINDIDRHTAIRVAQTKQVICWGAHILKSLRYDWKSIDQNYIHIHIWYVSGICELTLRHFNKTMTSQFMCPTCLNMPAYFIILCYSKSNFVLTVIRQFWK